MIYLEMSRDMSHGGGNWSFPNCVWAPTEKRNGGKWPFWTKVLEIREGDVILHLRGINPEANFVGFSVASGNGYITHQKPPLAKEWSYSGSYYRANLDGFTKFHIPINLLDLFDNRKNELESYFNKHKNRNTEGKNIFFVRQSGRLQCLNGAYLSDVDTDLLFALFGVGNAIFDKTKNRHIITVQTGTQISTIRTRSGQSIFATEIKKLYKNRCCFPGCEVNDSRFLIGSHIARWCDNESLRGDLRNGLCLCLMHDKAFESGVFTLDEELRIYVNPLEQGKKSIVVKEIIKHHGEKIKVVEIAPSISAVREHRERVDIQI